MKLTHIDNASCIYEEKGFQLLADPWLTDGAFEGSWYHYPPLSTTFDDIKDVDALYISHLHPDHYDETILKQFRKDIPVLVLDHGANFLHRKLEGLGFTNLVKVKDKETKTIGPFEVTLYAPFVKHPFDHSELGNFIDSALVIKASGRVILNANDNTPDKEAGKTLFEKHGPFSVVQLKDALAGAYPSCFTNLSHEEKLSEAKRLIDRQLTAMCEVAKEMKAEWFQPFAGDYQLAGKLVAKNRYLGVPAKSYSAQFILNAGIRPLLLNERGSIDLVSGELKQPYCTNVEPYEKWTERVKQVKFPYEFDSLPDWIMLSNDIHTAIGRLTKAQARYNYYPDLMVYVNGESFYLGYHFSSRSKIIKFTLDNRLLAGILTKRYHWNNAEVGCHIEMDRTPNVYDPDLVNMMSFFHV
jgi:UDP-MurNAc hydroxylase